MMTYTLNRVWVNNTYDMWTSTSDMKVDELAYTAELIEQDIRNNSAWNHRYQTIAHTTTFDDQDVFASEIDYVCHIQFILFRIAGSRFALLKRYSIMKVVGIICQGKL
jgi:hypothetical protein